MIPSELDALLDERLNAVTRLEERSRCVCGKARYATEKEAGRAVKRMRYRGRSRSYEGLLHPYMCPERKGIWHVGHTDE